MQPRRKLSPVSSDEDLRKAVVAFMNEPDYWQDAIGKAGHYFVHSRSQGGDYVGLSKACYFEGISLEEYVNGLRKKVGGGRRARMHIAKLTKRQWTPLDQTHNDVRRAFLRWWRDVFPQGRLTDRIKVISLGEETAATDDLAESVFEIKHGRKNQDVEFQKKVAASLKSPKARAARLAKAPKRPRLVIREILAYERNPDVVAEVLTRAKGRCEKCRKPAPFLRRKNGTPYLEIHHKIQLANGGEDTVQNATALCPNCHRREHHG